MAEKLKMKDKDDKYLPSHIANYLLWRANKENVKDLTPMKLLKLVYFCYGWYLTLHGKHLFSEKVEAWQYGPVIPSIYHEFKRFRDQPISNFAVECFLETGDIFYPIVDEKDDETFKVLDVVWDIYKNKSGIELSAITHEQDSPWCHAYAQGKNTPMNDDLIIARVKKAFERHLKN